MDCLFIPLLINLYEKSQYKGSYIIHRKGLITMTEMKVKVTVMLATLFGAFKLVAIPWVGLILFNVIDYITGINAAPYRDQGSERPVKSYKSIKGITKKVNMHLLIVVGFIVDLLIRYSLVNIGIQFAFQAFSVTIACWLCFNEVISILENMKDAGTPIPAFLMPLMRKISKKVEDTVNVLEDEKEGESYGKN